MTARVLRIPESQDFSQLDLEAFPTVEGFALALRNCGSLGYHIDLVDGDGRVLAGFPWWDNAEVALKILQPAEFPKGTRDVPFDDLEQGWQIYIFEEGSFVYLLEGDDACCTEFRSWFRVRTADYLRAWSEATARAQQDRRTAVTLAQAFAAKGEVQKLDLNGQELTELPEEIGELAMLEELQLARNVLATLPAAFGRLKRLRRLEMNYTGLVEFPRAILELENLETLEISYTKLRDVPDNIGRLEQLRTLVLSSNDLSALPEAIFRLPHLTDLVVTGSTMTSLPRVLGLLPAITFINLSDSRLPDEEKARLVAQYPSADVLV